MTRADVICKMFQEPVRTWIIENAKLQKQPEWLERENSDFGRWGENIKAFSVLDYSFEWSSSKEGHEFWKEIFDKLKLENR